MHDPEAFKFMIRCLELAVSGEGMTYPNPLVGCVIVNEGRVIGEGYHLKSGGPHAEVVAVNSVKEIHLLKSSTLYVSLEPCSHFGKTPPCTGLIISSGIPKVVIGASDTNDKVTGKGAEKLKEAGVEVIQGMAEDECRWINRRFFTFHEKKRPYIILKWAESSDGFIDLMRPPGSNAEPNWITGMPERILVHRWRASEQAILVGAGTVRADNPRLDVREWKGDNPVRLILTGSGELPEGSAVFKPGGQNIIFTFNTEKITIKQATIVKLNPGEPAAGQITDYLYKNGIQSVIIEGGAQVLNHFISTGLWDEARIFRGKTAFGDGVKAPLIKGNVLSASIFSQSTLEIIVPPVS